MQFPTVYENKNYYTLNTFFRDTFGKKVFKVSLNGGFSCPNFKDGGCIYCKHGSGDFAGNQAYDVVTQFYEIKEMMEKKWPDAYYIGYFQANTNTYAPVSVLKEKYEPILKIPGVVGLSIATRSDAISEDCLEYLSDLNRRTFLQVELGLQTIHEKTLSIIKRGHSLENFEQMVYKLDRLGIRVVVHLINGLPYETKEDMLETVRYLNTLPIFGIKIHMLHVLKDTPLEEFYEKEKFPLLCREEYVEICCDQLELLRNDIVIERITGDPKKEDLVAPEWVLKKFCVLNEIDKELKRRGSFQGKRVSS